MNPYPRWIHGDPTARQSASIVLLLTLRDVGEGIFVGGVGAELCPEVADAPVVQLYDGLPRDLGRRFDPRTGLAVGERALRRPFFDGDPVDAAVLDEVAAWCAGEPVVLVQCQAGYSRSASVGYALLRARGVAHAEALRRVVVRVEHHDRDEVWPRRVTLESCVVWANARYGR